MPKSLSDEQLTIFVEQLKSNSAKSLNLGRFLISSEQAKEILAALNQNSSPKDPHRKNIESALKEKVIQPIDKTKPRKTMKHLRKMILEQLRGERRRAHNIVIDNASDETDETKTTQIITVNLAIAPNISGRSSEVTIANTKQSASENSETFKKIQQKSKPDLNEELKLELNKKLF